MPFFYISDKLRGSFVSGPTKMAAYDSLWVAVELFDYLPIVVLSYISGRIDSRHCTSTPLYFNTLPTIQNLFVLDHQFKVMPPNILGVKQFRIQSDE